MNRPSGPNADKWHLFLSEHLDNRAGNDGLAYMALQIAGAIDEASNLACELLAVATESNANLLAAAKRALLADDSDSQVWADLAAAIACASSLQTVVVSYRDLVATLERNSGDTDTDPRWQAAEALRRLPQSSTITIILPREA